MRTEKGEIRFFSERERILRDFLGFLVICGQPDQKLRISLN